MYLREFFKKYIEGTPEKAIVPDRKMFLCCLSNAVTKGLIIDNSIKNVYITSRCIKHLFDKKPAEEFLFIIRHLYEIVKYPDKIYKNKTTKRGEFCFLKKIEKEEYLCSLEIVRISVAILEEIQIATAFRLRDEKYLKNYTILWNWGSGAPHRSALDAPKESTNAPQ